MKRRHSTLNRLACALALFMLTQSAMAGHLKDAQGPWKGSKIQLGVNINTGNTDAAEANGALGLDYRKDRWKNALDLTAAYAKSQSVLSKKKYTAKDELSFALDEKRKHFLFVQGGWVNDYFSPYSYQSTVALGYGQYLIDRERVIFILQAGPGYRNDKVRGSGDVEQRIIGTLQAKAKVKIGKNAALKEVLQYDSGPPFNYVDSTTCFESQFMRHWALKVSFDLEYYSRIPPMSDHTEKLDTTTTIALVYKF